MTSFCRTAARRIFLLAASASIVALGAAAKADGDESGLRLASFDVDATPPVGSMMAYDRVRRLDELGLRCRGVVILGAGDPIAVDWIGIANEGHDAFRETVAKAAGTTPQRVAVHTLHQHDAPRCDFGAERLLHAAGATDLGAHEGSFAREVLRRLAAAVEQSIAKAQPLTHAGFGTAEVFEVASNRRILGPSGKVEATRYTATRDAELQALPAGTIDPQLSSLSFWDGDRPLAVLTYYACHPQSYYRTGVPSPDFPGIARFMIGQEQPDVLRVHFNGAGGNVGAGKYNDGSPANRLVLADRVADAMRRADAATQRFPIGPDDVSWSTRGVALPVAPHLQRDELSQRLSDWKPGEYWGSPDKLAWVLRREAGREIELGMLRLGDVRVLHMPGELFVEYQLAAKAMRPDLRVAMAAYGDYGPGYIGTAAAYAQGGYETSEPASNVAPGSEQVLIDGMRAMLGEE